MRDDDDTKPKIFALTSAHVLNATDKRFEEMDVNTAASMTEDRMIVTNLFVRDHAATHLSRKRSYLALGARLGESEALIEENPGLGDQFTKYQEACRLRPSLVETMKSDRAHATEYRLEQRPIGRIYLCSGVRIAKFPAEAIAPLEKHQEPFAIDYGFIEIYPEFHDQCINELPTDVYPRPSEYPAAMDIMRASWSALDLGVLGTGHINDPSMTVMKAGRTTGVTFGFVDPTRIKSSRSKSQETRESTVHPFMSYQTFAAKGDSGAAIINGNGHIVGILSGGKTKTPDREILPMQVIRYDLEQRYKLKMTLYRPDGVQRHQPEVAGGPGPDPEVAGSPDPDSEVAKGPDSEFAEGPDDPTGDLFEQIPAPADATVLGIRVRSGQDHELRVNSSEGGAWHSALELHQDWNGAINTFLTKITAEINAQNKARRPNPSPSFQQFSGAHVRKLKF